MAYNDSLKYRHLKKDSIQMADLYILKFGMNKSNAFFRPQISKRIVLIGCADFQKMMGDLLLKRFYRLENKAG